MIDLHKILNSTIGRGFISIILGIGLASLFRKVCKDRDCIEFNGPLISQIDGKTYKFGDYCYQYKLEPAVCDSRKKIIPLVSNTDIREVGVAQPITPSNEVNLHNTGGIKMFSIFGTKQSSTSEIPSNNINGSSM